MTSIIEKVIEYGFIGDNYLLYDVDTINSSQITKCKDVSVRVFLANHNSEYVSTGFDEQIDVPLTELSNVISQDRGYTIGRMTNGHRKKIHYEGQENQIVLDIDDGCSILQARQMFRKFCHAIVTTRSHGKEGKGERFRVFLPTVTNTPDTDEARTNVIVRLFNMIGKDVVDANTKDSSRFFYASLSNKIEYFNDGILFDWRSIEDAKVLSTKQSPTKPIKVAQNSTSCDYIWKYDELNECYVGEHGEIDSFTPNGETNEENKLKGIRAFLDTDFYQGNKSSCLFSAGCLMVDDGFSDDVVVDFLMNEWETRKDSTDKFKDALKNIKGALKKRK